MQDKIYVILMHTGSYSDYRCSPITYVLDEDMAKSFCEKATAISRNLREFARKEYDRVSKTIWYNDYSPASLDKRKNYFDKLKAKTNPFNLEENADNADSEALYDYQTLERYNPQ